MVPEVGHLALVVAFCMALVLGTLPIVGAARGNLTWMGLARPVAQGQLVFIALAYGCLTYAFVTNDFSVAYVANHSNSALPLPYKIAGVWGGHEGSLLLWVLILSVWMVLVSVFSRQLPQEMVARVLGVMGLVGVGFLAFMLFTSNPFERMLPAAADGRDLNPLLQDPGLVIHPPMLYMGYVGFSVAFAFAIAALLSGRMDATWARWSRPWTTVAWMFLTLGVALGSWWAYYELGWGGWWFWDPVENASFMPWLIGTALVHSLAVTEKRGSFKSWTVLLAIFAFSMSLLGTFLVRSGLLTSVHSFANDPERGVFILAFLILVVGSSLLLYAWRAPRMGLGGGFAVLSRESFLLTNNVLLTVAAATVLLGTLYPMFIDALVTMGVIAEQNKVSVGPPYFNMVFVPLMAPAVFLMAVGPFARWKQASLPDLAVRLRWALAVAVVTGLLAPFAMGEWSFSVSLGLLLAFWVFATVAKGLWERLRMAPDRGQGVLGRLTSLPRSYLGMQLAHLGVAVLVVGVTLVTGYETERDVRMEVGDTVQVAGYTFRFDGTQEILGPNYEGARGTVAVMEDGNPVTILEPEKRVYRVQRNPMTEVALDRGVFRDLYVALGDPVNNQGAWSVRVYYKPFVRWIWGGAVLMALGGLLAISDRRYRLLSRRQREVEGGKSADGAVTGSTTVAGSQGQSNA